MTSRNKIILAAGVFAAALLAAKHIIIDRSPVPANTEFGIDLEKMRAMARSGPLPESLRVLAIGDGAFPASAVVAGQGLTSKYPMVFSSFQILYPNGKSIIVDTALGEKALQKMAKDAVFHADRFAAMHAAMRRADKIILTHEHPDHIGGIADYPDLQEIQKNLALSKEQILDKFREQDLFTPANLKVLESSKPLEDELYQTVAPGIVVLKSPSHSPGTQFIYLVLKNGNEFLFVGDIAWSMDNVRKLTGKPLLMNLMFLNENRDAVAAQLRALHNLTQSPGNKVHLIVAHDATQLEEYLKAGLVTEGFR